MTRASRLAAWFVASALATSLILGAVQAQTEPPAEPAGPPDVAAPPEIIAPPEAPPMPMAEGPMMGRHQPHRRIVVSGLGEVRIKPDMATLTTGVVTEAATAADALAANNAAMQKLMDGLKAQGVADPDLQTATFTVQPKYARYDDSSGRAPRIEGYTVTNELRLTVRDLAKLGSLLDQTVQLGANQSGAINFALANPEPQIMAAREAAVKDARAKAELYARAAGVALGEVILISDAGDGPHPMPKGRMQMAEMSSAVPVAIGEESVSASVTVTFAIR